MDPTDPSAELCTVDNTAVYQQNDPSHSIHGTTDQIYSRGEANAADMNGFVSSYAARNGDSSGGSSIMKCFSPEHVPVITQLATEFALFDGWFASVPGPTMVNRAYAGSATSHGMGTNDKEVIAKGLPQKTMYKQLLDMGLDYRVYFQEVPSVAMFKDMRRAEARRRYRQLHKLADDLAAGDIPEFVWIEPSYFDLENHPASDQHPDHDVSAGEQLIKEVYDMVRSSPIWNNTAFIITYDEHGGFFDHVIPPTGVPNPDGLNSTDDPFDFTRLGIRIPTVVVSPLIPKGTVVHAAATGLGQYEHSSILSTVVHKLFQPAPGFEQPSFLTKRDEWAATFESVFSLTEPRTNCPVEAVSVTSHRLNFLGSLPALNGEMLLTDLQKELVAICAGSGGDKIGDDELSKWTEREGAVYCKRRMDLFLATV